MDFDKERQELRETVRRSIRNLGDHDAIAQFVKAYLDYRANDPALDPTLAALHLGQMIADKSIDYLYVMNFDVRE